MWENKSSDESCCCVCFSVARRLPTLINQVGSGLLTVWGRLYWVPFRICDLQAHPIHLFDACSGAMRCTYRAYDAVDEITAAHCVTFNSDGTKVYAGYNKVRSVLLGLHSALLS